MVEQREKKRKSKCDNPKGLHETVLQEPALRSKKGEKKNE